LIYQFDYMKLAINEAIKARKKREVPVGAIIVDKNGNVIAKAHNLVETRNDATNHAEKLVIEKALKITGNRYLNNYDIWVTLEPCIMCASIIKQTRIRRLYYGSEDKKGGAIDNGIRLFSNINSKSKLEIYSGFYASKSQKLLKEFFREIR
jgi:tRNA(adenine34) deaminase